MNDPLARFSVAIARRRRIVVGIWVVILLLCATLWPRAETAVKTSGFELPQTQSAKAKAILQRQFGASAGAEVAVVYHSRLHTVRDSIYRREVNAASSRMARLKAIRSVLTFFNSGDTSLVSRDRHTTLALVSFKVADDPKVVVGLRGQLRGLSIEHYVTGDLAVQQDTFGTSQDDLRRFEIIAIPIMLILLLLVFRTAMAATMPLLLGACSVTVTTAVIALIASATDVSVFALNVASMIGLGLGIDFSLILITRFRQEMARGFEPEEAIARTMATAGRSVAYSAVTVVLSMLVMTLFMHDFMILRSISMGVTLVALTSLISALTLLPAVLRMLGPRIEWLRVVPSHVRSEPGTPGIWYRLSHRIMRRPWVWLVASALVLAIIAIPVRDISTGVKTVGDLPVTAESVRGADVMSAAFGPGRLTPIQIVLETRPNGIWTHRFLSVLRRLTDTAAADPRAQSVESLSTFARAAGIPSGAFTSLSRAATAANPRLAAPAAQFVNLGGADNVALITIVPRDKEFAASHQALVRDLRDRVIPAIPQLDPYTVLVGGEAANSIDFDETVYGRFPLIVGMVLLMTFVVLLMFFHSVTLPLKALLMNLATMVATYGALVALFQYGWGAGPLGFTPQGMLDLVTPVILYAILFALSTDYEVFMLSRVKEYYRELHNNTEAVASGLQNVGGMITAAGLILIATFGAFATADVITLKELGLGLAIGVLLDSTIVRIIMVPATMRLMGDWNWWMPRWLKGVVPELREGPVLVPAVASAAAMETVPLVQPVDARQARRADQTMLLERPPADAQPAPPPPVGRLRPVGRSIGTDVIMLPHTRPLRIGRDPSNELQLFDPRVSRFHGRIDYRDGTYYLADLGSTNGMSVNRQPLPPHRQVQLRDGDVVEIGNYHAVTFTFELSPAEHVAQARQRMVGDAR